MPLTRKRLAGKLTALLGKKWPGKKSRAEKSGLKLFAPKEVKPELIENFWKQWKTSEKPKRLLIKKSVWTRKVWALSPTVLVTVRRFDTKRKAKAYVRKSKAIERKIMRKKPKNFVLQPVQFFGIKGCNVLERVYPGPDCAHLPGGMYQPVTRYWPALEKRLKRKGFDAGTEENFAKLRKAIQTGIEELGKIEERLRVLVKAEPVNTLILDYDPTTGKVLLAKIDNTGPHSISEGK